MRQLENYGVQELNAREMTQTDGGGPIADFVHWLTHLDWSMEAYGRRLHETGSPGRAK